MRVPEQGALMAFQETSKTYLTYIQSVLKNVCYYFGILYCDFNCVVPEIMSTFEKVSSWPKMSFAYVR